MKFEVLSPRFLGALDDDDDDDDNGIVPITGTRPLPPLPPQLLQLRNHKDHTLL